MRRTLRSLQDQLVVTRSTTILLIAAIRDSTVVEDTASVLMTMLNASTLIVGDIVVGFHGVCHYLEPLCFLLLSTRLES
jgi:hypothetical protein